MQKPPSKIINKKQRRLLKIDKIAVIKDINLVKGYRVDFGEEKNVKNRINLI